MRKLTNVLFFALGFVVITSFAYSQTTIHYWGFNDGPGSPNVWDIETFPADIGDGELTHTFNPDNVLDFGGNILNAEPGVDAGGSFSVQGGEDLVNNSEYLELSVPTVDADHIILSYATRGTGSGFTTHIISYSVDGENFIEFETIEGRNVADWSVQVIDFSEIEEVNNNENFTIRITVDGATGDLGNNRFDNIKITSGEEEEIPTNTVTFYVDMTDASPFDPTTDDVFIAGTIAEPNWQQPGTNADLKMEPNELYPLIYSITLELLEGNYQYKYFRVIGDTPSWDHGEWAGDPNRSVEVTEDTYIYNVWGDIQEVDVLPIVMARDVLPLGSVVTIEGVVTRTIPGADFSRIQDETAGFNIRQTAARPFHQDIVGGNIGIGTVVRLHGTVAAFNQLRQFNEADLIGYQIIGEGELPNPIEVTLADIATEGRKYQSMLLFINDLEIDTEDQVYAAARTYRIKDASVEDFGVIDMRTSNAWDSDIDGLPVINPFSFTGVLGQFHSTNPNAGFQIMPILATDIEDPVIEVVEVATIAELRSKEPDGTTVYRVAGEVVLTFNSTFRNRKAVQDATAGIVFDDDARIITTEYNRYDGITGITGTLGVFSNLVQFVPVIDPGPATSSGNVVYPEKYTFDDFELAPEDEGRSPKQGQLVVLENVTVQQSGQWANQTSYTLEDAEGNTFPLRTDRVVESILYEGEETYIGTDIPDHPINIVGYITQFSAAVQIVPRKLGDFFDARMIENFSLVSPEDGETLLIEGHGFDLIFFSWEEAESAQDVLYDFIVTTADLLYHVPMAVDSDWPDNTTDFPLYQFDEFLENMGIEVGDELTMKWTVVAKSADGQQYADESFFLTLKRGVVSVEERPIVGIPDDFNLSQNYPNPFNPSTTINFDIPKQAQVTLEIYNILGQRIHTLISGETFDAGYYNVVWEGRDQFGRTVSSGVYLYRLQAGDFTQVKKMLFLK